MNFRYIVFILIFSFSFSHGMRFGSDDNGADASAAAAAAESCVSDGKQEADGAQGKFNWSGLSWDLQQKIMAYVPHDQEVERYMLEQVAIPSEQMAEHEDSDIWWAEYIDKDRLVVRFNDCTESIFDITKMQLVEKSRRPKVPYADAVSPDSTYMARISHVPPKVCLYTYPKGKFIGRFHGRRGITRTVTFSPNGKLLAFNDFNIIQLRNLKTKKRLHVLRGHDGMVHSVVFRPDGKQIASVSYDQTVRLWDVETGAELQKLDHEGSLFGVTYSPDGRNLVSASYRQTVKVWDLESGLELQQLHSSLKSGHSITFSPDGNLLTLVNKKGKIELFDFVDFNRIRAWFKDGCAPLCKQIVMEKSNGTQAIEQVNWLKTRHFIYQMGQRKLHAQWKAFFGNSLKYGSRLSTNITAYFQCLPEVVQRLFIKNAKKRELVTYRISDAPLKHDAAVNPK